jgi:hypothetical protein
VRITGNDEPPERCVQIAQNESTFATLGRAKRAVRVLIAGVATAALIAGCGNRLDTEPSVPAAIVITSASGTTAVAGSIQFSATVTDANGHTMAVTPTWSVVNGGGTITADGLFTAGDSVGTFVNSVVATTGSVTSSSTVTVTAGALASITVTPETVTLALGATQQFTAVGKDAHDNVVPITPAWSVVAGGGTVDATSGMFTAGTTAGVFTNTVKATSGSISATASVTVSAGALESITVTPSSTSLAIGTQQTFTAVGYDGDGNVVPITPTWEMVGAGGGTIDGSGVFTAGTVAGTFTNTVRARVGSGCGSTSGRASVTVLPGALTTVTVSPGNPSVLEGATQQFTAVGTDAHGNVIAITPVWDMTGAGGGTIDGSTGLFTAGSTAGAFANTVRATASSVAGTASVTVTPAVGPLASIVITPANPTLFYFNNNQQFTATGYDSDAHVVPIVPAPTWSVNPAVGSINPVTGVLTTLLSSDGFYLNAVTATSGSIVGQTSVTTNCGC